MRLIDADKALELFRAEYKNTENLIKQGETHLDNLAEGYTEAAHIIRNNALAVDAVPVALLEELTNIACHLPYKDSVRRVLIQAPTVDAVQVTRCMDCESARELTQHENLYLADGVLICTNREVSENGRLPVWPQHFCGYGRQKDGGGDDAKEG